MGNADAAKTAYQAFSQGDLETLKEGFAEDAEWQTSDELPLGGVTRGRDAIPRGEYLAWVAEHAADSSSIIGGAGVQLRPILPRPRPGSDDLELGPEAIVLNVYVESAWRRRGVAEALMRTLLQELSARAVRRIVLHASNDGRRLYERLGFVPTNEMRLSTS